MRRRLLYIYLLLIAGIIACETVIVEAAPNFYFKQLSQQDGLSQNFVRSIMLDHDGFLWVGTKSGISRFDYHEFKNYSSVPDSAASLPGNLVHFIVEDARHNIWISTGVNVVSNSFADECLAKLLFTMPLEELKQRTTFRGLNEFARKNIAIAFRRRLNAMNLDAC